MKKAIKHEPGKTYIYSTTDNRERLAWAEMTCISVNDDFSVTFHAVLDGTDENEPIDEIVTLSPYQASFVY